MRKGNVLLVILILVGIITASVGGYFYWQRQQALKNEPLTWEECIKIPGSKNLMIYPGQCIAPDGRKVTQPLTEDQKKNIQPPDETANWKTYTTGKFSFKYPPDWVVGKFEHFPDMLTLQPSSIFVAESQKNSILISISNHCLNTQCLTIFNLEEMIQQISAMIISKTAVDKLPTYKISLSGGKTAYVLINGPDFIQISTDKYFSEMDQILSTFKFL